MFEQINKAAKALANDRAGWVTRRDAAEYLGKVASAALSVLHENQDEMDVDVRREVEKALGAASAGLAGIAPMPGDSRSLEELAKACVRPGRRKVQPHGDGFVINVKLKDERSQDVYAEPFKRTDGAELIRVFTYCGKASADAKTWALRANMKLTQGALAITKTDGEERFVLVNCFLANEVTPAEFKDSVKEVAFYGDWVEQKLTGLDDF